MKELCQAGIEMEIQCSPGHAEKAGRETADRLAKEAAKEAEDMPEDKGATSQAEVKQGARESVVKKWQRRWEISEKGRNLFNFKPKVKLKYISFQDLKYQRTKFQLQSGYSKLREFRHKVGLTDDPYCEGGEVKNPDLVVGHRLEIIIDHRLASVAAADAIFRL